MSRAERTAGGMMMSVEEKTKTRKCNESMATTANQQSRGSYCGYYDLCWQLTLEFVFFFFSSPLRFVFSARSFTYDITISPSSFSSLPLMRGRAETLAPNWRLLYVIEADLGWWDASGGKHPWTTHERDWLKDEQEWEGESVGRRVFQVPEHRRYSKLQ